MKNSHLSSVAVLLLSLSFVVGILVSDFAGARFLTAAHAQAGSRPASVTVLSNHVEIADGSTAPGIYIRNVIVNGQLIPFGFIPGSVHINHSTLSGSGGVTSFGVVASDSGQCSGGGVIVSDGGGCATAQDGVIVSDGASVDGVIVSDGMTATGGTLVGDGIIVSDGIVTGSNLRLVGATLTARSASVSGVITSVRIPRD